MLDHSFEREARTAAASLAGALAQYAATFAIDSHCAIGIARQCLLEGLTDGFEAIRDAECASLVGPLVPGAVMPGGARVPGTSLELDPAQAAFCMGLMMYRAARGEHWLASVHERVNEPLGAILATADYQARKAMMEGTPPPKVRDVLGAIVKTLEIQAVLGLPRGGHPPQAAAIRLTRIASAAIATAQLGGTPGQIVCAIAYACRDEAVSRADESHAIGPRGWIGADAISRAVQHACRLTAGGRSNIAPALDARLMQLADDLLGGDSQAGAREFGRPDFGSHFADRIARSRKPLEVAMLTRRFHAAVDASFPARQAERIKALFGAEESFDELPFNEMMAALVANGRR